MKPDTPAERVAVITWYLASGMTITTQEAAKMAHISHQRAWEILCEISRVLPIYQDDRQYWTVCKEKEV